jgi:hypothetical protein
VDAAGAGAHRVPRGLRDPGELEPAGPRELGELAVLARAAAGYPERPSRTGRVDPGHGRRLRGGPGAARPDPGAGAPVSCGLPPRGAHPGGGAGAALAPPGPGGVAGSQLRRRSVPHHRPAALPGMGVRPPPRPPHRLGLALGYAHPRGLPRHLPRPPPLRDAAPGRLLAPPGGGRSRRRRADAHLEPGHGGPPPSSPEGRGPPGAGAPAGAARAGRAPRRPHAGGCVRCLLRPVGGGPCPPGRRGPAAGALARDPRGLRPVRSARGQRGLAREPG